MPTVPAHDYQCPCDMCEPEAHSVAELPDLPPVLFSRKQSRPTLPATSAADRETAAFEELVQRVGEGKARWSKLLELLEDGQ